MYFITTLDYDDLDSRCLGYFENFNDAAEIILTNRFDIHEGNYQYAVIEDVMADQIYPETHGEWWFEWNNSTQKYNPIDKPEKFSHLCNFSIG